MAQPKRSSNSFWPYVFSRRSNRVIDPLRAQCRLDSLNTHVRGCVNNLTDVRTHSAVINGKDVALRLEVFEVTRRIKIM